MYIYLVKQRLCALSFPQSLCVGADLLNTATRMISAAIVKLSLLNCAPFVPALDNTRCFYPVQVEKQDEQTNLRTILQCACDVTYGNKRPDL